MLKILRTLLNGPICDNGCNDDAVKVRDSCYMHGKYMFHILLFRN